MGVPGLLSLFLVYPPSGGVVPWAILANPVILLVVFAFAGASAAPVAGCSSRVAGRVAGASTSIVPNQWHWFLALGIALGCAIGIADHVTRPLRQAVHAGPPSLVEAWSPAGLIVGVFYGGVIEEIIMRWGLMSILVVAFWRLFGRGSPRPSSNVVWSAITLSALIFAASHLPGLVAEGAVIGGPLLFRTLLWNGLLGVVFGAVFAHRDLESAMLCHAGFHIGLIPAALLFLSL